MKMAYVMLVEQQNKKKKLTGKNVELNLEKF